MGFIQTLLKPTRRLLSISWRFKPSWKAPLLATVDLFSPRTFSISNPGRELAGSLGMSLEKSFPPRAGVVVAGLPFPGGDRTGHVTCAGRGPSSAAGHAAAQLLWALPSPGATKPRNNVLFPGGGGRGASSQTEITMQSRTR